MVKLLLRVTLFLLALNHLVSRCEGYGSYGGKGVYNSGKYGGKPYKDPMQPQNFPVSSADVPGQSSPVRRGLGISAWGIVVLILALILGGMGFYYFSIFYPIFCKKERDYTIQLDNV